MNTSLVLARSLAVCALFLMLLPRTAVAQCGWFNGSPLITYVGCATVNDQAYGRSYRIVVPLLCYNNCGAALPGHPFIRAVNLRTGFSVEIWSGQCDFYAAENVSPCAGATVGGFSLLDHDFQPGDVVRIDTVAKPPGSDVAFACTPNIISFHYPSPTPPEIAQQPQAQTVASGSTAIFRVFRVVAAPGALSYEWRKDGVLIPGADRSTLAVEAVNNSAAGSYDVRVRNDCGMVWSAAATLTVVAGGPVVIQPPPEKTACEGETVAFTAEATFAQALSFQWLRDEEIIPVATFATLVVSNTSPADAGRYRVVVTGGGISFTTAGTELAVRQAPRITRQPQSFIVCQQAPVSLSAGVTGAPPFGFQWRLNGLPIPGATNSELRGLASGFTAGTYDVVVTNACGAATSAVATVSTLRSALRGDGRVLLEWSDPFDALQCSSNLIDWVELPGAASPYLAPAGDATHRFYRLHCGDRIPTVLRPPDSAVLDAGERVVLSGRAEGPPPLSYQWLFNGTNLAGATSPTLILASVQAAQVGVYELRVSNGYGAVTSQVAYVYIRHERGGLAFNSAVANPSIGVLLLNSDITGGLPRNTTTANPAVSALLLDGASPGGLPFNTTLARPGVNALLVSTNGPGGLPLNSPLAPPPVRVEWVAP